MKHLRNIPRSLLAVLGILWAAVLFTGCQSKHVYQEVPGMPGNAGPTNVTLATPRTGTTPAAAAVPLYVDEIHVGDSLQLTFAGAGPDAPIQAYSETVKEDGTITPPQIGHSVKVVGKTPGVLQKELQVAYNKTYTNLTVTVKVGDRFYNVHGEVRSEGPKIYLGKTTIVNAISAAGGFTDFSNKKKVRLTRANGVTQVVNVQKAIEDPQANIPVYPGDDIYVPRRWL